LSRKELARQAAAAANFLGGFADAVGTATHDQRRAVIEALMEKVTLTQEGELEIRLLFDCQTPVPASSTGPELVPASKHRGHLAPLSVNIKSHVPRLETAGGSLK
jgi:hypothetical protein